MFVSVYLYSKNRAKTGICISKDFFLQKKPPAVFRRRIPWSSIASTPA